MKTLSNLIIKQIDQENIHTSLTLSNHCKMEYVYDESGSRKVEVCDINWMCARAGWDVPLQKIPECMTPVKGFWCEEHVDTAGQTYRYVHRENMVIACFMCKSTDNGAFDEMLGEYLLSNDLSDSEVNTIYVSMCEIEEGIMWTKRGECVDGEFNMTVVSVEEDVEIQMAITQLEEEIIHLNRVITVGGDESELCAQIEKCNKLIRLFKKQYTYVSHEL